MRLAVNFFNLIWKILDRIYMLLCRSSFNKLGKNVIFHPMNSKFTYSNITIGDNVSIGENAFFNATVSHIYIGNNIAIAPNVTIRGGNHRFDIIGKWITDYKKSDKRVEDDEPVFIESDCWIGTNVTILKGVTIGRGSIVAAGSVVNKTCAPYSIVGGVPAKVIKFRWDSCEEILAHEEMLYKESDRLRKEDIEKAMNYYHSKKK
ncbi:acyltransferase [Pedobacter psychroterrae]|uniref:Acyltransferase n=1 Tax=Pedobacter psychroterrae TaxID=2530453 RepID=A0A4R0NRL9_9SPHI|nr:acyltransferase [Pedobacter psychroterrae]TCD02698.1 acyltransferase [Pedobacter psychroterrae]